MVVPRGHSQTGISNRVLSKQSNNSAGVVHLMMTYRRKFFCPKYKVFIKTKNCIIHTMSETNKNKRIAVGMSGGVDSSVTAYLLKEAEYDVVGVHIKCWDSKGDGCTAEEDRADAVAVATKLGIRFEGLDFVNEYKSRVIEYFYNEYEAGRTPNPDVLCNKEIKFGMFLEWALKNGFDAVATGHYARVEAKEGYTALLSGVDHSKDQSYFLYALNQDQLRRAMFPLGGMKKSEVRSTAKELGLVTASKPDSMGICFVGRVDIKDFLKSRLPEKTGEVVNTKGEVIGVHEGAHFYTIGQRHGFEITKYVGMPIYVLSKDISKNQLIVGSYEQAKLEEFEVELTNQINPNISYPLRCGVRIRHLGEILDCNVQQITGNRLKVKLDNKYFGVAPGQSAVFYLNEEVLMGGIIL